MQASVYHGRRAAHMGATTTQAGHQLFLVVQQPRQNQHRTRRQRIDANAIAGAIERQRAGESDDRGSPMPLVPRILLAAENATKRLATENARAWVVIDREADDAARVRYGQERVVRELENPPRRRDPA